MLNEGQFAGTGGWVLKPYGYRGQLARAQMLSRGIQNDEKVYRSLELTIEILAAQDLPLLKEDSKGPRHPYVKCQLHVEKSGEQSDRPIEGGGKSREGELKIRSSTKNSKGADPDFGGERMQFAGVTVVEDLTFVRYAFCHFTQLPTHWSVNRAAAFYTTPRKCA